MKHCRRSKIEVIHLPANSIHFLQPCDDKINKTVYLAIRKTRDRMATLVTVDFASMNKNLIMGVALYKALASDIIRGAFLDIGLWPME